MSRSIVCLMLLSAAAPSCFEQNHRLSQTTPVHASQVQRLQSIVTTICRVRSTPEDFYDKRIVVQGCVTTDGIENTVVSDQSCPNVSIAFTESAKLTTQQRVSPAVDREICGTFAGFFRAQTKIEGVLVNQNVLEVDEAADLKTTILKP